MELTIEQAFGILVQAVQQVKFTLADADTVNKSIQLLHKTLLPVDEPVRDKPKK